MEWVLVVLVAIAVVAFVVIRRRNRTLQAERAVAELEPVKKLAFEDVTALGVELQDLDLELAGKPLDVGANADYQRALDSYEAAKTAADGIARPSRCRTSPRSSTTAATQSPASRPEWPATRCPSV